MLQVSLLLVAAFVAGSHGQATIGQTLVNDSAVLGGEAFFYCEVVGTQTGLGDGLQFSHGSAAISNNDVLSNTTKYSITGKYNLTINSVTWSDEGEYTCLFGTAPYIAYLIVSDPPTDSYLYWPNADDTDDKRTWTPKDVANELTCESTISRPPATFRWYRGSTEVTNDAVYEQGTMDNSGYATAKSKLTLTPTASDEGVVYTCYVDIPETYYTKTLPVSFSGAGHVVSSILMVMAALTVSMKM